VICSLFYCFENCDGEHFHFDTAKTVAAPFAGAPKDLGCQNVHTTRSPSSRELPFEAEAALTHEAGVLGIALASRCGGIIGHDTVCSLLTEYLQEVSFAILAVSYLFVRCWVLTFSCFCI
jgi:hypothetical protein